MVLKSRLWVAMACLVVGCGGGDASDEDGASPAPSESEVVKGKSDPKSPTLGIELRQADRGVASSPRSGRRGVVGETEVAKIAMKPGPFALRFPKEKDGVAIQITACSTRPTEPPRGHTDPLVTGEASRAAATARST